jgi:hypothetical protein
MAWGVIVFIIAGLVIAIWMLFELKHMKHKLFALFLIALILFGFFSFNAVFKGKELPINNLSDLGKIAKVYFSWLSSAFNNVKIITTQAIKMDWSGNSTNLS